MIDTVPGPWQLEREQPQGEPRIVLGSVHTNPSQKGTAAPLPRRVAGMAGVS